MKLIQEIKEQFENLEREMREKGSLAIMEALKEIFALSEEVKTVSWTQYTPYFNDGDECRFGVNGFCLNADEGDYWDDGESAEKIPQAARDKIDEIFSLLNTLPNDCFKMAFGDHARIIVSKNEAGELIADVEGYEHE